MEGAFPDCCTITFDPETTLPLVFNGLAVPLNEGEAASLLGEDGLAGPRNGEDTVRGDDNGLSTNDLFTLARLGGTTGVLEIGDDDNGVPGWGNRRSRLFVSCQNLAGTLMPRGKAFGRDS